MQAFQLIGMASFFYLNSVRVVFRSKLQHFVAAEYSTSSHYDVLLVSCRWSAAVRRYRLKSPHIFSTDETSLHTLLLLFSVRVGKHRKLPVMHFKNGTKTDTHEQAEEVWPCYTIDRFLGTFERHCNCCKKFLLH